VLEVVVADAAGLPVQGARVHAQPDPAPEPARSLLPDRLPFRSWGALPAASAGTDERGLAVLPPLAAGTVTLTVRHPGYATASVTALVPGAPPVVQLRDAGALEGEVLRGGAPVSEPVGLELYAADERAAPVTPRFTSTAAGGRFAFPNLDPGEYVLAAMGEHDRPRSDATFGVFWALTANRPLQGGRPQRRVRIEPARTANVAFELSLQIAAPDEPCLTVLGTVLVNGLPAAGRKIQVWQQDCYRVAPGPGRFAPATAVVAADGTFALPRIRAPLLTRKIRVNVRTAEGDLLLAGEEREVDPGAAQARFDFSITAGSLDGELVDEDGRPVAGRVSIASAMVAADADGRFHVPELAARAYDVQAFGNGITNLRGHVIEAGLNRLRIVVLEFCRVAGVVDLRHVELPAGMAVSVVMAMRDGAFNYRPMGLVDRASGRFQIGEPPMAGEYEFFVHCAGRWYRHPEVLAVHPRRSGDLRLLPVPCEEPRPPGPGLLAPRPPLEERKAGGLRPGAVPGLRPLDGK
jgi:hypothetical protein